MDFAGTWNSSVKYQNLYHNVKAKIILDGAKETLIRDGLPGTWPQMAFCVILQVHTAYNSKHFGGLIIETVSVDFKPSRRIDVWPRHWSFAPSTSSRLRPRSRTRGPLDRYFRPQATEEA